jgi:SPP1 gp7 family putative phage head morphogenesis protein
MSSPLAKRPDVVTAAERKKAQTHVKGMLRVISGEVQNLSQPAMNDLLPVLVEAEKEVAAALRSWLDNVPNADERFTAHRYRQVLAQLRAARNKTVHRKEKDPEWTSEIKNAMELGLERAGVNAAELAASHIMKELETFDAVFGHQMPPIPIRTAVIVARNKKTLVPRFRTSAARYAGDIWKDLKQQLAIGVVRGESIEELTNRLVRLGGPRGLVALRGVVGEPHAKVEWISEGLFTRYRYWGERLARTELINAYNVGADESLKEAKKIDDGIKRRWDASLDSRLCIICQGLHGEVREIGERFSDGSLHPPSHPNCRCACVAWHADWDERGITPENEIKKDEERRLADAALEKKRQAAEQRRQEAKARAEAKRQAAAEKKAAAEQRKKEREEARAQKAKEKELAQEAKREARRQAEAARAQRQAEIAQAREKSKERKKKAATKAATKRTKTAEDDRVIKVMKEGEFTDLLYLGGGANDSRLASLKIPNSNTTVQGVWKPARGEERLRPNIKAGTYYKREAAAYNVSRHFGVDDMVPRTVVRHEYRHDGKTKRESGSLQEYIRTGGEKRGSFREISLEDVQKVRVFDFVMGNSDRHGGNMLVQKTPSGRHKPILIDNGLALPNGTPSRTVFPREFIGRRGATGDLMDSVVERVRNIDMKEFAQDLFDSDIEKKAIENALYRLVTAREKPELLAHDRNEDDPTRKWHRASKMAGTNIRRSTKDKIVKLVAGLKRGKSK